MCNCKRVRNFEELREAIKDNSKNIRVSKLMKIKIFMSYLLFSFKNVIAFGYNLIRYDNLKEWTKI